MRTKITLACTECKQRNYNTTKDKKTHPDRMETKKYCRFCKTHTLHKEGVTAEFKKISWPERTDLIKQSIAVLCTSVVVGVIIAIIDTVVKYGINNFLVK